MIPKPQIAQIAQVGIVFCAICEICGPEDFGREWHTLEAQTLGPRPSRTGIESRALNRRKQRERR
jgi:hypothetical protein